MKIEWDSKQLSKIFQSFVNLCHVNINVVDCNNTPYLDKIHYINNPYCTEIHKVPQCVVMCIKCDTSLLEKCHKSRCVEMHICHAGLTDIVVPIIWNGEIISYVILGQIKTKDNIDHFIDHLQDCRLDIEKMKKYYDELPLYDYQKINDIISLSKILSKYIIMEKLFRVESNNALVNVCNYIDENLTRSISIDDIIINAGISKSALYKQFKAHYRCTPGDYINDLRINKSVSMLLCTDYSIDKIAESMGFSNSSYYSKLFKKAYGISPMKYRKLQRN